MTSFGPEGDTGPELEVAVSHMPDMPMGSSRRDGSKVCTVEDMSKPSSTRIEHVVVEDPPREIIGKELPPIESMLPMQLRLVVVEESSAAVMRSKIGGFDTCGTGLYELARLLSLVSALPAWRAAGT